jgi:flagellar biosynthesis chaperone FliJ
VNEFKEKLQRIEPIIRAKKAQYDQEVLRLKEIREEKQFALKALEKEQKNYLNSVEILNKTRQSGDFSTLDSLEDGIEFVKAKWVDNLRVLRTTESREEAQQGHVLVIQRQLKSFEKLSEIYENGSNSIIEAKTQKELEEFALQEFNRRQ